MCGGDESGGNFGCPKCTDSILERKHGWIECKSTSFPGKVYYFHTTTRCSTWHRPVPRNVRLPIYQKFRDHKTFQSPTDEQNLSSSSGVSGTEISVFPSDVPPTEFELHARRMQIYLRKNTDYDPALKNVEEEILRDKLLECYKTAKAELAKKLKEKNRRKNIVKVSNAKPKICGPVKPVKTVRECHGIITVSYDPVPRELPIGVKMPDLSETSVDSFALSKDVGTYEIGDEQMSGSRHQKENIKSGDYNEERFGLKDLNLSESEITSIEIDSLQ